MKSSVGLIGLGLMGKPMGKNWLKDGFPLTVWNRTKSRADDLIAAGAKWGASAISPRSLDRKSVV